MLLFLPASTLKNRRTVLAYLSGWLLALHTILSEQRSWVDEQRYWTTTHFDLGLPSPARLVDISVLPVR